MRKKTITLLLIMILLVLSACTKKASNVQEVADIDKKSGQIYLYGEMHGVDVILDKEFELWSDYYHNRDMRHLFVELPYYTAEFLNLWMKSDNDEILEQIYKDMEGTASHKPSVKEFYKKIKKECPETIFHGTDVGHQYYSIGTRFINYLNDEGLEESEQYILTQEAIEQGKHYYKFSDSVYREKKMVENFTREFDKLEGESIMGIYGSAHTGLESMNHTNEVPSMANQLKEFYEGNIYSEDLSHISKEMEALKVETVEVDGKEYKASYFGKEDMTGFKDLTYREFWRLEDAYKDMKDKVKTGDLLPDNNYPMKIEIGQVFMISYGKTDGSIITAYYRSDGTEWKSMLATEEFILE